MGDGDPRTSIRAAIRDGEAAVCDPSSSAMVGDRVRRRRARLRWLAIPFVMATVPVAHAQPPTPAGAPAGDTSAISSRYRFLEKYGAGNEPDLINRYRVATRETTKITSEKPQGAPDVVQTVLQSIYRDRVAKVNAQKDGAVTDLVRHYDQVKMTSTVPSIREKNDWLKDLTILYRLQAGLSPQILSLEAGRQLRQQEYEHISLQTFLPLLPALFPRRAARVGDRWPVAPSATWALVGEIPSEDGYDVNAELREIRPSTEGGAMTAIIEVTGKFAVEQGPTSVNAQVSFKFVPSEAKPAATGALGREPPKEQLGSTYDARGHVTKVRMAQVISSAMPGSERLKLTIDRSLILERRTPDEDGGGGGVLDVPDPLPASTPQNSWLLYDDPLHRFHLKYPQEFQVARAYPDGGIDLLDRRPDGQDVLQVNLISRGDDAPRDRPPVDPIQERQQLEEFWRKKGEKLVPGQSGWLPDQDWAALKRRVYRIEIAVVPKEDGSSGSPPGGRVYIDHYIVQFATNKAIKVMTMTTRDPHLKFREMAESLIKTFEFGKEVARPAAPRATAPSR